MSKKRRYCAQADIYCTADRLVSERPRGLDVECWSCGLRCCLNCTIRVEIPNQARDRRVCHDCADAFGHADAILDHLHELSLSKRDEEERKRKLAALSQPEPPIIPPPQPATFLLEQYRWEAHNERSK